MAFEISDIGDDFLDFRDLEDQLSQICDRSEVEECLKQQLLEVEMLQSMFSNPGEFVMDDPGQLLDVNEYTTGKASKIPARLDFSINLSFEKMKVEVCINLPLDYPVSEPDIFVRNNMYNRDQQHMLNEDMTIFIDSLERGETCLCSIIYWIQENVDKYVDKEISLPKSLTKKDEKSFMRLWIYSHHIYSKNKRKDILSLAEDLSVTGFMLPGKPGIICVEGDSPDCEEWWARVRAMNWKKIMIRKNETIALNPKQSLNRFATFEEISFKNNRGTEHHMDMGEFFKYLEQHQCAYVFMDYFGVSGRTTN